MLIAQGIRFASEEIRRKREDFGTNTYLQHVQDPPP
jgi:hypothetical protein